ncbi:MAG TPA: SEC-C domain-containing protein [Sedimentisphaerales bacterium]|nr:SEC-C domain-containing protein [Sedimentisphaerales bacterium]
MERTDIIRQLLQAAGEFNSRKLWKRFTNYDCFGVRIEGEDELMLGVVLGDAGEEYGLSLFRGPGAAACLATIMDSESLGDDAMEDLDMLGFSMEAFGNLLPETQRALREAGQRPRYDEQVPHFLAKAARRRAGFPGESDLRLLLLVLRAVVEADKKKLLRPTRLDDRGEVCVLNISGEAAAPQVTVTQERLPKRGGARTIPFVAERLDLKGLPHLDATWLVGMPTAPVGIAGDDRITQMVLVVDEASEYVFQGKPVMGGDLREAVEIVVDVFHGGGQRGQEGLPRKILFSSRKLYDAMTPMLVPAGVECVFEPEIPALQAVMAGLAAYLGQGSSSFAARREAPEALKGGVPAPDDLKGWKEADQKLYRCLVGQFQSSRQLQSSRAVKRYFGDDDLEYYVQEHEQQGGLGAYMAWAILDYRPNKTSQTQAEKMLAKGLPGAEAILLRARMEACPTLFRVAGHDPKAGTIDLEDILLGGSVTAHDRMMSENIEDGIFFAARAFPAGRFHFVELAGPPLGPMMGLEAVDFLRRSGMEFTREGLRRDAHLFGWLWQWIEEWEATRKPRRIGNTDGEELLWHTASFSVASPDETRRAMMKRPDIEYDEQADELVWNKPTEPSRGMMGETVTLGRIEFVGDELVLTVNSTERFARARKWLEKLPGVAFKSVRTRRWDEAQKDRPLDERISPPAPVEMTPELNAAVQEMMNKHYMAWTDMSLPALGGKTPRQACQTEAGRGQVLMLIRTMPDPMGPGSVRVPREAMMRELGLATESPTSPRAGRRIEQAPIPIESVPPKAKVARNAPCPCGSGRKYKKCCGREDVGVRGQ